MLQLPDYWIWDSWITDDGELYTSPRRSFSSAMASGH
jgi:hypothetical protein